MITQNIAIVTSTLFKHVSKGDMLRADLALRAASEAKDLLIKVISVDGGSDLTFNRALKDQGVEVIVQRGSTMGAARREAIEHAVNSGFTTIVYTELEKKGFIPDIPKLCQPIEEGQASIVIPHRKDLSSYPEFQQHVESLGNEFWRELTGLKLDLFFGPRIFSSRVAGYFLNYKGEYGDTWDSIFIPILRAFLNKETICSSPTSFNYPENQKVHEAGSFIYLKKRITQLSQITKALEDEWNKIQGSKQSFS